LDVSVKIFKIFEETNQMLLGPALFSAVVQALAFLIGQRSISTQHFAKCVQQTLKVLHSSFCHSSVVHFTLQLLPKEQNSERSVNQSINQATVELITESISSRD
jgi:hypothetical protein